MPGWMRGDLGAELDAVETGIGLWLDRLESGDYADRATVAEYLARLQRVDFELFITSAMLGRARPRSARLREAIDRLMLSSADVMLAAIDRLLDGPDETALAAREEDIVGELRRNPSVHPVRLPDVWLRLGRHFGDPRMLRRAIDAAAAIGATGLEAAARRAIGRLGTADRPDVDGGSVDGRSVDGRSVDGRSGGI